ncbi:uncharacterized protein LOC112092551, partial [Morus notabilis]|uniref:uncharacterized protein LOC112092551 n=1 Tax=Morus notabilis TaxID=981085 RepID=UPI000CED2F77
MDDLVCCIGNDDSIFIGGDFNGHVGKDRKNFERIHGGFGFGAQSEEGKSILEFALGHDFIITNTFFKKRDSHLILFKNGRNLSQIDYFLTRYRERSLCDANTMWDAMTSCTRKVAKEVRGESTGKGPPGKEPGGGVGKFKRLLGPRGISIEIHQSVRMLKLLNKYKKAKKEANSTYLDEVLTKDKDIMERWRSYFEMVYNDDHAIEFDDLRSQGEPNMMYTRGIRVSEVKTALRKMKNGKACGPYDIPIEVWMALGDVEIVWLIKLFKEILKK